MIYFGLLLFFSSPAAAVELGAKMKLTVRAQISDKVTFIWMEGAKNKKDGR